MRTINKLITEPYIHSGKLKTKITSGFATVSQKSTLVGLKLLANASIIVGDVRFDIDKGKVVYISEEILHSAPWAKTKMTSKNIKSEFIVVEPMYVIGFE